MQLLNLTETIKFMSIRRVSLAFSLVLRLASFGSFFTKGLNWGRDVTH